MRKVLVFGSVCASLLAAAGVGCSEGSPGDPGGTGAGEPGGTGGSGAGNPTSCAVVGGNLPISAGPGTSPSLAFANDGYILAWQSIASGDGDVHVARIAKDGTKLGESVIAQSALAARRPSIQSLGNRSVVLWEEENGGGSYVRGRYITSGGEPDGAVFTVAESGSHESRPRVAANAAGRLALAWMDVPGALVGVGSAGTDLQIAPIAGGTYPAVATAVDGFALAWVKGTNVAFSRLGATNPSPSPVFFRQASGPAFHPQVAESGGNAFVVWEDQRLGEGNEDVYLTRITGDIVAPEVRVPMESGSANFPAIAWAGDRLAVAYYQFTSGPPSIMLSRFNADLTRDGAALQVSTGGFARFPTLAWSGSELGVAWAEKGDRVYMARVVCP